MLLHKIQGLEELENDDLYKQFLADDFDVKSIASAAVQCAQVAEHLARLSGGISLLDKALHRQVKIFLFYPICLYKILLTQFSLPNSS